MKFRPQVQLRFRNESQFAAVKKQAEAFKSVNEMILLALEARYPGLADAQVGPAASEIGREAAIGQSRPAPQIRVAAPKRVKAKVEKMARKLDLDSASCAECGGLNGIHQKSCPKRVK